MEDFLDKTRHREPDALLQEWLPKLGLSGIALDLGCGSGAEAELLARSGFMVDAIDKDPISVKYAKERCEGMKVDIIEGDFREFNLRPDYYSVVVSINALPFIPKADATALLEDIKKSLKTGGAALIYVYGPEHEWAGREDMSFWTKDEFGKLWEGFETLELKEYIGMWPLRSGTEIHQHRIRLVARKND